MDGSRFDALSRSLSAGQSRRGLTRLLAGVAVGGPLALLGRDEATAKNKKVTLCRSGQTMTVSKKAKKKYLKQGATLGACAAAPTVVGPPVVDPPSCPVERQCANGCCPTGQVCNGGTECCTEDVAVFCFEELQVSCGTWPGPCGRPVSCGTCFTNFYCKAGSCACHLDGELCGPEANGEPCCSGRCGLRIGFHICRRATCSVEDGVCLNDLDCCEGVCLPSTSRCHKTT